MSKHKTPAEKVSLDAQSMANIIERRLNRVSGREGECAFVLAMSVPNTSDDLSPDKEGRVIYVSNCKREDGAKILSSLLVRWLNGNDDNAYFAAKALSEAGFGSLDDETKPNTK